MSNIQFNMSESTLKILNPFHNFSEDVHTVQVRRDPLLGDTSVYNRSLKDKVKFFFGDSDPELIKNLVKDSAKTCIFCGDRIEKNTPQYPSDLVPEGRVRIGEATLFPNLFPIGSYHSVISLSTAHFLKLSEFNPELIENGLNAAQTFVNLVYRRDHLALFVAVNANYLFPAGATFVHPHLQMLITSIAYSYHERLIEACHSYYRKHGSFYYDDLVREEKKIGERYVGQKGRWHWITSFSPMGINEVIAINESESDFGNLSITDLRDLSQGISKILTFYESIGHLSFNYSLLSARGSVQGEGFRCILKMITRQNLYPNYRNDDYFLQKILHSELIINLPEELASKLREYF
jgi:UDPglucose--hexose-1-phosphate uridylyltransferase